MLTKHSSQLTPITPGESTQRFCINTHQRASLRNGYNPVQILHIFIQTFYFTNMNFKEYRIEQTNVMLGKFLFKEHTE